MNKNIECFFEESKKWKVEYDLLRKLMLDTGLKEDFKWGKPTYSLKNKNIVLVHGFKEYCALLFHKGVLLKDEEGILVQQTKNVQAARQLRFSTVDEIKHQEKTIIKYVHEAIEVEKVGLEVQMKKTSDFEMPDELTEVSVKDSGFEKA